MSSTNDQLWEQMLQSWPDQTQTNSERAHNPDAQSASAPPGFPQTGPAQNFTQNENQTNLLDAFNEGPGNFLESPSFFELDASENQIQLPVVFQLQEILDQ